MKVLRNTFRGWHGLLTPLLLLGIASTLFGATVDTGDISTQASAFLVFFQFIGAICAVVAIVFAGLAIRGRNIGEGLIGVLCAIGAIFIIAHAKGWVTSITGIGL